MSYNIQLYRKETKEIQLNHPSEDFFENEENLLPFTPQQKASLTERLLQYEYIVEKEGEDETTFINTNYYKDNNHVIFHMGNIVEIIKDADPETFKPLHTTYPAAKDKNNFYLRNEKVNESDIQEYLTR